MATQGVNMISVVVVLLLLFFISSSFTIMAADVDLFKKQCSYQCLSPSWCNNDCIHNGFSNGRCVGTGGSVLCCCYIP
ncbi:hypothetical protein MRB53_002146 [Persea americana]|uniref:Uncharacterized protein n=1 Tax=Persea americana TaxID=3435 RepID=A0ACC2MUM1_PERAE|nr:hypothetical protein MRB53_002146 [Persea americana]